MSFFKNKKVLVTGGSGMIGRQLVKLLLNKKAKVTIASLDDESRSIEGADFVKADLRKFESCLLACKGKEIVFQLAGVKGSPVMTSKRPASFFVPTITMSINMMEAARRQKVENYLFTSSVGVYSPAEIFFEDDVWKTFPSPNDKFAGWAKRMGELQAEAYDIEYGWKKISILRPANVYGTFDNFDSKNAMVIPSLIKRAFSGENPLTVWGDGSAIRDFVNAKDVARAMMFVVENNINEPLNIGSGKGVSIKEIVEILKKSLPFDMEIEWDKSKSTGDNKRLMDISKIKSYGFKNVVSIEEGIKETIKWYSENKKIAENRFNPFTEKDMMPDSILS